MPKLTLNNISTFINDSSAVTSTNANYDAIETALENTLSRDGTSPNTMTADFDMNNNDILNVGTISVQDLEIDGDSISDIVEAVQDDADAAAASALAAASSASTASSAATEAQAAQVAAEAARDEAEAIVGSDYVLGVTATNSTIVVDNSDDQNPTIKRAAIDGDITIADGSNTAAITANSVVAGDLKAAFVDDFTEVVVTASDTFLLGDASDSGNTKRDTIQGILDLVEVEDQVARDMAITALIAATSTGGIRGPIVSWVANTDNFSTKTNATFTSDHYRNPGTPVAVSGATGTTGGNMTNGSFGGNAAAFDADTTANVADAAQIAAGASAYSSSNARIGKDYGAGTPRQIAQAVTYGVGDRGYATGSSTENITISLRSSDDGIGTNPTVHADTTFANSNAVNQKTLTVSGTPPSHRYWWIELAGSSGETPLIVEVVFYDFATPANMTLSDDAETITTGADLVDVYVIEKTVDASPTRRIRASIDNGSTWATGSLATTYTYGDKFFYHYECDVSAQTGTSLKIEYNTLNDGKERNFYRIDAVPLYA